LTVDEFAAVVRGRLIVSCQADADHPLRDTPTQVRMARAAVAGGAAAIRCGGVGGVADVAAIAAAVEVPVIGLTKHGRVGVYITPTVQAARAVVDSGAGVVAVDATTRPRPDGRSLADTVRAVHNAGALIMADVSTLSEGVAAVAIGADIVATTLAGYASHGAHAEGPDLALVATLRPELPDTLLIAEGRIHTPQLAAAAIDAGADAVVVGTAITDPSWITTAFAASIRAAAN
jgi:N-acylglucosamine-6-phosphate 2-epimerase